MPPQDTEKGTELRIAFEQAPTEIRDFISAGSFDAAMRDVKEEVGLPADKSTLVEIEVLMALLGATDARTLPENLTSFAHLDPNELVEVLDRVTTYVFGPLAPGNDTAEIESSEPPLLLPSHEESMALPPTTTQSVSVPSAPKPAEPAPSVRATSVLENFHSELARSAPIPAPQPLQAASLQAIPVTPSLPTTPSVYETFHARTMASDIEAMGGAQQAVASIQSTMPPAPPPRYAPITTAPAPAAERPSTPTPTAAPETVRADLKKYGIDPYREPVE